MSKIKGLLVRVGIDQTFGKYNAPINPDTGDYIYMPIPESPDDFKSGMRTSYDSLLPYFESWCRRNNTDIEFPQNLNNKGCHLDPDFDCSTYGDRGTGRGLQVGQLQRGDFLIFFASYKPIKKCSENLIYALYGMMVVDRVLTVNQITDDLLAMNAHTRVNNMNPDHLVVFANTSSSGRFKKAIPIGEYRDGAYRVKKEVLDQWGDIDVKNGFIQRSVRPPWFSNPQRFLDWLESYDVELINRNWE